MTNPFPTTCLPLAKDVPSILMPSASTKSRKRPRILYWFRGGAPSAHSPPLKVNKAGLDGVPVGYLASPGEVAPDQPDEWRRLADIHVDIHEPSIRLDEVGQQRLCVLTDLLEQHHGECIDQLFAKWTPTSTRYNQLRGHQPWRPDQAQQILSMSQHLILPDLYIAGIATEGFIDDFDHGELGRFLDGLAWSWRSCRGAARHAKRLLDWHERHMAQSDQIVTYSKLPDWHLMPDELVDWTFESFVSGSTSTNEANRMIRRVRKGMQISKDNPRSRKKIIVYHVLGYIEQWFDGTCPYVDPEHLWTYLHLATDPDTARETNIETRIIDDIPDAVDPKSELVFRNYIFAQHSRYGDGATLVRMSEAQSRPSTDFMLYNGEHTAKHSFNHHLEDLEAAYQRSLQLTPRIDTTLARLADALAQKGMLHRG